MHFSIRRGAFKSIIYCKLKIYALFLLIGMHLNHLLL